MNYLKLINQFWKLRRSKRITSKQADLYFYLIQECNSRDWENPFECSNKSIIASIDMKEPTLIDARNRLKQLGLIDFKGGKRNEESPVYTILYLNNLSRKRDESIVESEDETEMKGEPFSKPKQNETVRAVADIFKKLRNDLPETLYYGEALKLLQKKPEATPENAMSYITAWAQRITKPRDQTKREAVL